MMNSASRAFLVVFGFFGPRRHRSIRSTGTLAANSCSTSTIWASVLWRTKDHSGGGTAIIMPGYTSAMSLTNA